MRNSDLGFSKERRKRGNEDEKLRDGTERLRASEAYSDAYMSERRAGGSHRNT